MSKYSDTKTAIKTILENISGIGKVFDYKVYTNDWTTFFDNLVDVDNKLLKIVWFYPSDATEQGINPEGSRDAIGFLHYVEQIERWTIEGHYAHDEATISEYQFNAWRELIEDAFRFQQNITTGLSINVYSRPLQRRYNGLWTFTGDIMVHRVEWTLELVNKIINPN